MKVLTFGTFDGLHPGHLFVLSEATKRGDLFVIVARDLNVFRIKGKWSKKNEGERLTDMQEVFPQAHIRLGDPSDFFQPIREIKPDLIVLGYDQKMPPGIREEDLPCTVERLPGFEVEKWKSSRM